MTLEEDSDAGNVAGPPSWATSVADVTLEDGVERLGSDVQFAVIHDEPFITIVFENGMFWGTVVDGTMDKLDRAMHIAARYNLNIAVVRVNDGDFDLYLTEVHDDAD